MGEIISYKCSNCEEVFCLRIGGGMLWYDENISDLDNGFLSELIDDEEQYARIINFINNSDFSIAHTGMEPYKCMKCSILHNKLYIEIESNSKKMVPIYKCDICESILEKIQLKDILLYEYKCKNCGCENTLLASGEISGMWD